MDRVLVVGGTGTLGRPVVRQLIAEGRQVRLLARDAARTKQWLHDEGLTAEVVAGSVDDADSVERAVRGCRHVHVSLAGGSAPGDLDRVEHRGTALVAEAAARRSVELLTYLSGSLVRVDYGQKIPEHRAKLAAEEAIRASGVPHLILRPTYVMDTLPRHVQGPVAVAIGHSPPLHMVSASDLARLVVRAYRTPQAAGRDLHVHGPEPVTVAEALRTFCSLTGAASRVVVVPHAVMSAADRVFLGGRLRPALQVMALLDRLGERGDPGEADRLLGPCRTTLVQWCTERIRSRSTVPPGTRSASGTGVS